MRMVGVIGSRSFRGYARMKAVLDALREEIGPFLLVSGGADGADLLAERYAREENDGLILVYRPRWAEGKHAAFARNAMIAEDSELIVAFWDGASSGTKDTLDKARKLGREVRIESFSRPGVPSVPKQSRTDEREAAIRAAFDLEEME